MKLREYQEDLVEATRVSIRNGHRRVIAVLPTGGGKTFTFSFIVKGAFSRGRKILIITDRVELMTQAGGALQEVGLTPVKIEAGKTPYLGAQLYTGMVETISRRVKDRPDYQYWLQQMDIIIIDECHKRSFTKLFPYFREDARVLGFTATPSRTGKKDQLADTYTDLVVGVEIGYLVRNGFLAQPKYYGVKADLAGIKTKAGDYDQTEVASRFSETKLYRGVVENWQKKTPNTKTLVFSSSISNSLELVDEFKRVTEEVRHLDATMSKDARKDTLRWFAETPKGILCNVGILTTGFDEPSIQTVILYRATKSLSLYLQMVGRGSRTTQGKSSFNILDFGNNITTHGLWHEVRPWGLTLKEMKDKPKGEAVLKNCPNCEAFIPVKMIVCTECGHVDVKEKKEQEFAELELINPRDLRRKSKIMSLKDTAELCKRKLLNSSWVIHNLESFDRVEEFLKLMGYSPYWMEKNHSRFWFSNEYIKKRNSGKIAVKIY